MAKFVAGPNRSELLRSELTSDGVAADVGCRLAWRDRSCRRDVLIDSLVPVHSLSLFATLLESTGLEPVIDQY